MKVLVHLAGVLLLLAGSCLVSSVVRPEMAEHGVALALTATLAVGWSAALEYLAAQRRAIILEAWEERLKALEAKEAVLRSEVDTLKLERSLGRM